MGRRRGGSKLVTMPTTERDEQETWTREQIEAMDADFIAAMQRAIAARKEHAPSATAAERK
jgi:hypothetical protein